MHPVRTRVIAACLGLAAVLSTVEVCCAQAPLTYNRVLEYLELEIKEEKLLKLIGESPIQFTLSKEQTDKLRAAGATERVMAALVNPQKGTDGASDVNDFVLILDASGSMKEMTSDGKSKWDVARKAACDLIDGIPEGRTLAMIVYGHDLEKKCEAVDVLHPLAVLTIDEKARLKGRIDAITPIGNTPIASSLRMAGEELKKATGLSRLILITDGTETCGGDPAQEAGRLAAGGARRASVNVIGFSLNDKERESVEQIATVGRGRYYDAKNAAALVESVKLLKEEIAGPLTDTEGASDTKPGKGIEDPSLLESGKYVSGRLGGNRDHYWRIKVPTGRHELVLDATRPDGRPSTLSSRVELGNIAEGAFRALDWDSFSGNSVRGRAVLRFESRAETTYLVRVACQQGSGIMDYKLGLYCNGAAYGVPYLVRCPKVASLDVGQKVTTPVLALPYEKSDAFYRIKLEPGDYLVESEFERADGKTGAVYGIVDALKSNGTNERNLILISENSGRGRGESKLILADPTEILLRVRSFEVPGAGLCRARLSVSEIK